MEKGARSKRPRRQHCGREGRCGEKMARTHDICHMRAAGAVDCAGLGSPSITPSALCKLGTGHRGPRLAASC